jgi:AraC-like DNA-binding protein
VRIFDQTAGRPKCFSKDYCLTYFLADLPDTIQSDELAEQRCQLLPGTFAISPPGTSRCGNLKSGRYVQIRQSRETYTRLAMLRGGSVPPTSHYRLCDPLVSQIVLTIAKDIEQHDLDYLLADALNTALAIQVTRLCTDTTTWPRRVHSNGLSSERLRRVQNYVEAHLSGRLTLTDLASLTGLSIYHFSRSFKQAVGIGPQRYVIRRRLERAKKLMQHSSRPLAWIARQIGFVDQSHLISAFRREIGMTPGRYRALAP